MFSRDIRLRIVFMANGRFNLSKAEVIDNRLLDLEESLEALRYIGIDDASEHLVRQYQTRRLIRSPQFGPAKKGGGRYQGYFGAEDILAIADIRLRLKNRETLEEIGFNASGLMRQRHNLYLIERKLLRTNIIALSSLETVQSDFLFSVDSMKYIKNLVKLIKSYKMEKERIEMRTLGLNLDPKYSKKLMEFLENKFKMNDDLI